MAKTKAGHRRKQGGGVVLTLALAVLGGRGNLSLTELLLICSAMVLCLLYAFSDWFTKRGLSVAERIGRAVALIVVCSLVISLYGWHFWPKISFAYISPAVFANEGKWDFVVRHKGPNSTNGIEVMFTDKVKEKDIIDSHNRNKTALTVAEINSYTSILTIPAIAPACREHFYAQQFLYQPEPEALDHEHYWVAVSSKEIKVYQDLRLERVDGKWFYASEIRNASDNSVLLSCKDRGFPGASDQDTQCWPMLGNCDE
jgi:hypothetical protein